MNICGMWDDGSDVELHVGGADQQELEQQGLSKSVGRDRGLSCWL